MASELGLCLENTLVCVRREATLEVSRKSARISWKTLDETLAIDPEIKPFGERLDIFPTKYGCFQKIIVPTNHPF